MLHLLLLFVCILSVEIFVRLKFFYLLYLLSKILEKVIHVIPAGSISDHWKERVIIAYSLRIMKYCIQMILIMLIIVSLFFIGDYFINNFLKFTLSFMGIINSMVFTCGYVFLRKSLVK